MPLNIFAIQDTFAMLNAIEQIDQPLNFLTSQFFNRSETVTTDYIAIEYRKEGRLLAPAIVNGARGVDVNRGTAQARYYKPVTFAPRRVIGLGDLQKRLFGEIPNLYTSVKPEERVARLQAQDLSDLMRLHANRREQLAAEILQRGKLTLKAYADDGQIPQTEIVDYDWNGEVVPLVHWDNPAADIYGDLMAVSLKIQEFSGVVPTLAICGKNVEKYLLANTEIKNWLMIQNRENLTMASLQPHFTSPECRFIGRINALNLDLISYAKTYINEAGQVTPFIDDNSVIIACPNLGRTVFAPVTLFDKNNPNGWSTIAAPIIPNYTINEESRTLALTLYSSYILIPDIIESWLCVKTCG